MLSGQPANPATRMVNVLLSASPEQLVQNLHTRTRPITPTTSTQPTHRHTHEHAPHTQRAALTMHTLGTRGRHAQLTLHSQPPTRRTNRRRGSESEVFPDLGRKEHKTRAFEHFFLGCRSSAGGWRRQLPARESALGRTARGASAPSAQPQARPRSGAS